MVDYLHHGDHTVYLAEVVGVGPREETETLTLRDTPWSYGG